MKMKIIICILLVSVLIVSCAPGTVVPTVTIIPTTIPAPTITPTPAPQSLADTPDLPTWVEEYVHAYGGKVTVNNTEIDTEELTTSIRQNPEAFTQTKTINSKETSFLVVNEVPLAIKNTDSAWREIGYKDLKTSGARPEIGSAVDIWSGVFDSDPQYKEVFAKNFEIAATGGTLSDFELMSKIPNQKLTPQEVIQHYDWTNIDKLTDFLNTQNIPLRAMHLIDGYTTDSAPAWLSQMTDSELEQYIYLHIKAILTRDHYAEASVVNEAFWGAGMPGNNFWYSRLGEKYIEIAFNAAREISPDTKLILNDNLVYGPHGQYSPDGSWTNVVFNEESQAILNWVTKEKGKNIPMDGVGIESHIVASDFTNDDIDANIAKYKSDLIKLMDRYKAIHVDVYLTELDVNIGTLPKEWTEMQKQELKARIYSAIFEACFSSENCQSVTTWGFTNKSTWMLTEGYPYGNGENPLPLDDQYRPTASNYEIKKVIYQNLN